MVPRRWILSINPINGTDCIHNCYASFHPPSSPSSSSSHRLFANAFIAAVCTASAVFFLVLTYYTVLVRRRRADRVASGNEPPSEADSSEADYHVWRIRTVGLDESTINSIAVKPYIPGGCVTGDCSVCLGEFCDGDLVRLLPACDHAFHVPCIDTWLRAHMSCPLCRSHIIVPADSGSGGLAYMHPDGNVLISNRRVSGDLENDRGSDIIAETVTENLPGNRLQLVWRSNSVDSLPGRDLFYSLDREENCREESKEQRYFYSDEDNGNEKKSYQGSKSKVDCQQKSLAENGGESTSGSGKMLFFSRCGRARSSSVLPL